MPKKIKNCFYANLTFDKILQAHQRARKNKAYRNELIKFEINLENNIVNLINKIKAGRYHLGQYRSFIIREPKERVIKALPYIDRVVHQWYIEEFIKPYIVPRFIISSCACVPTRGTHYAASLMQKYMRIFYRNKGNFWILKCDIRKFFYNINLDILFDIMKRYIADKKLLDFTRLLIYEGNSNSKVGIPIGNYTSQFFANIYLNELDYYVKHELKIKYYVRYMDDFILLTDTKEECKILKNKIIEFCRNQLGLELNNKSKYYPYQFGVNFCGYKIWTTHRLIRRDSKIKIKRKVATWNHQWKINQINYEEALQSFNSWLVHIKHCDSYRLKQSILKKCDFLYTEYTEI
ncbi:MAG: RNA-directed DNA polymerase [Clostridia bacterium]|nr:RNA-directed DNA polymerase [Clostridia bacterium]